MSLDNQLVQYFDEWEQSLPPDARAALRPLFEQARLAQLKPTPYTSQYTCIGKGGTYEYVGVAFGAGTMRDKSFVVYRDVENGTMYVRRPDDFSKRMQHIGYVDGGKDES